MKNVRSSQPCISMNFCTEFSKARKFFHVSNKNQAKFCRKTCWKEQQFIFTVYLMNQIFQTSLLLIRDNGCLIELNYLCKHIKKIRCSQSVILVMNWIKQFFPVSIVNKYLGWGPAGPVFFVNSAKFLKVPVLETSVNDCFWRVRSLRVSFCKVSGFYCFFTITPSCCF